MTYCRLGLQTLDHLCDYLIFFHRHGASGASYHIWEGRVVGGGVDWSERLRLLLRRDNSVARLEG